MGSLWGRLEEEGSTGVLIAQGSLRVHTSGRSCVMQRPGLAFLPWLVRRQGVKGSESRRGERGMVIGEVAQRAQLVQLA